MIVTALDNTNIKEILDKKYGNLVYLYDFSTKEDVLEFLQKYVSSKLKESEEIILITKDELSGTISSRDYIVRLKEIYNDIRIIYITNNLEDDFKGFLFSNDVFDIIIGKVFEVEELFKIIDSKEKIVYKCDSKEKKEFLKEDSLNYVTNSIVIPKQLFAVYGTSGAGKSTFSLILARKLSEKLNINVALLDMDIQNPSIDILVNSDESSNNLSNIVDDVDKRKEISDIISKYMIQDSKNKKLSYMTNNVSLFECQNKLSSKYYEKIYSSVSQKYDYSIIDLPSSPFLDIVPYTLVQATKIFFVINANYVSIRQAVKYLDLITKLWNIDCSQIGIIINKYKKNSLDAVQIQGLLPQYKVLGVLNYDENLESYINGASTNLKLDFNVDKILSWLNINKKESKIQFSKYNIFSKVGILEHGN